MEKDVFSAMKRVGYWISDKKIKRLNFEAFPVLCRNAGIDLVKLDLDRPMEEQGPFSLIFHKLTDQVARADQGNERARKQIERFHTYTKQHPEVAVIDPLENLYKLLDRHEQYTYVHNSHTMRNNPDSFFMPPYVEFTSDDLDTNKQLMEQSQVQYPFVCKPSIAHGSSQCHKMMIVFNEAGLRDVKPPCVAQTFINHNAVLYKVFVIGQQHYIVERPSIKNFSAGDYQTIFFDSHDVSKADSASFLNQQWLSDDSDDEQMDVAEVLRSPRPVVDTSRLHQVASGLQQQFGLNLFGVDIIIENLTGRYAVIDINSFPGYDGVPDFFHALLKMIEDIVEGKPATVLPPTEPNNETPGTKNSTDTTHTNATIPTNGTDTTHTPATNGTDTTHTPATIPTNGTDQTHSPTTKPTNGLCDLVKQDQRAKLFTFELDHIGGWTRSPMKPSVEVSERIDAAGETREQKPAVERRDPNQPQTGTTNNAQLIATTVNHHSLGQKHTADEDCLSQRIEAALLLHKSNE